MWLDLISPDGGVPGEFVQRDNEERPQWERHPQPPYGDFFKSLNEATERVQPAKKRLALPEENEVNLHCVILGLCETSFREGKQDWRLTAAKAQNLSDLFAIVKPAWLDDMRKLSRAFYDKYNRLLDFPANLNPTFDYSHAVRGADVDLIINDMLIEIKTTVNPRITEKWVWQLLGYALLDQSDQHGVRHVGFYMARQKRLVWWELDNLVIGSVDIWIKQLCA